jgi:hypothetical protein
MDYFLEIFDGFRRFSDDTVACFEVGWAAVSAMARSNSCEYDREKHEHNGLAILLAIHFIENY